MADFDPVSYMMGRQAGSGGGGGGGSATLSGLTDVDISNPSDGQTLVYNATSGEWENGAGGGGGGSYTAQSPITINNGVIGFDGYQHQWLELVEPTNVTFGPDMLWDGSYIGNINIQAQDVYSYPELRVTFDGVTYLCSRHDYDGYVDYGAAWNDSTEAYDYSVYPFCVESDPFAVTLYAVESGTHNLKIEADTIDVSPDFKTAVIDAAGVDSPPPMLCVSGQTTATQVSAAIEAHRMMYFMYRNYEYMFVTLPSTTERQAWGYTPNSGNPCTVYMQDGFFTLVDNA